MTKLFTWEIIAQRQILQARHLRKNVSKIQIPSLQETFKQEILWFMTISVPWIRILASPLNCGAVSLLSCWQQQHQTQKLYILPLSCCIGSEYLGLKVILPQWPGFPLKLFSPNINTHKKRPWFHIKVIIMVMLSKSDVLNKKPLS